MSKNKINVSEIFHSMQGEGNTMGKPSVFLRLQACNLLCGNPQLRDLQGSTQKEIEAHQDKDAEWTCDTIATWLQGEGWPVKDLVRHLFAEYCDKFLSGSQLVITGGEPLLQQDQFPMLVGGLQSTLAKDIRVEIETNGTILPDSSTPDYVDQFNISPKLSNSGMPQKRRIKKEPLEAFSEIARLGNRAIFKFVITSEDNIQEVIDDYIEPFEIPNNKIWLMPGCTTKEQFDKVAPMVAETCKKHGLQFSSRLQINLWNETTGV